MRLRIASGESGIAALIDTPTRVLWGRDDRSCPVSWADRLADYFSNLEFSEVPKAGHFVHYERPGLANSEILSFLEKFTDGQSWL